MVATAISARANETSWAPAGALADPDRGKDGDRGVEAGEEIPGGKHVVDGALEVDRAGDVGQPRLAVDG